MAKTKENPILDTPIPSPTFSCVDTFGNNFSNQQFIDHWSVLYFYPKDMTSGCTTQARDFEAAQQQFKKLNCKIIGVSKDSCASHVKFSQKENLTYTLLSDPENNVCDAFGVWKEKSMYGRKYMGIERSTFIVDPTGRIVARWERVKVTDHVSEVLSALESLQA